MDDEIRSLLNEEIKNQIQDLSNLTTGSEDKSKAIDDLATLYKLRIEEVKAEMDFNEKYDRRLMEADKNQRECDLKEKQLANDEEIHKLELSLKERQYRCDEQLKTRELDLKEDQNVGDSTARDNEEQLKRDQMKADTLDRYLKIGLAVVELVGPLAFYATWMKRGFKFEETGTYTSPTFKGLFSRFKPTK